MRFITDNPFETVYGELVTADGAVAAIPDLPTGKYSEMAAWDEVVTSSSFLPYVQLYGGNSDPVKEGKIAIGNHGLRVAKDQIEDLGKQFDCFAYSWRFKAMRIITGGDVFSYFNPKSEEFQKVVADSETSDSGCMYGPEFLIWIPQLSRFATYFFSSKTARRESPNMKVRMEEKTGCTVKSQLIKAKKHSWHGPVVTLCSAPMVLPDVAKLMPVAERFANPKDSEVEKDSGQSGSAESDRPQ